MIEINGKKFALNDEEFTDSLFKRGGTCVGYYKVTKKEIKLYNIQKMQIGTIVKKEKLLAKCTILEGGKKWYSYGDIEEIGKFDSYLSKCNQIEKIILELKW